MRIAVRLMLLLLVILISTSQTYARYYLTGGITEGDIAGPAGHRFISFYVQIHETRFLADSTTIDRIIGTFYGRTYDCASQADRDPRSHCPDEPLIVQKDLIITDSSSEICAGD
jgi:hypothetical protein